MDGNNFDYPYEVHYVILVEWGDLAKLIPWSFIVHEERGDLVLSSSAEWDDLCWLSGWIGSCLDYSPRVKKSSPSVAHLYGME